jgi:hypothetical protein
MTGRGRKLREKYVTNKIKRNMIMSKLPLLSDEQVDLLYGMVKRWTEEEEVTTE